MRWWLPCRLRLASEGREAGVLEFGMRRRHRRAPPQRGGRRTSTARTSPRASRAPVRVAVGFSDTTCPPAAVYAAYNEIRVADKGIVHGLGMTHSCLGKFYSELGAWARK